MTNTAPRDRSVELPELTCRQCGHVWTPRKVRVWVCPACHSPRWDEPKET